MRDRSSSQPGARAVILVWLLASLATPVLAEGLYQVELMVFAYPAGGAAEQWEALPELQYPAVTRFLVDPREQHAGAHGGIPPAPSVAADAGVETSPAATEPSAAFVLLPAAQRVLGAGAASMQRSGRYRVLFHEAWVQPLPGKSTAVPLVLDRSGDGGAWPELQGVITLYQAGDYFLETDLWLNTQGDYLPGTWRMPPPPRGPARGTAPANPPAFEPTAAAGAAPDRGATDYPYRHAVLLQKTRRMRGGQVHYIDHPMLGVVARIMPLEEAAPAPGGTDSPPQMAPMP